MTTALAVPPQAWEPSLEQLANPLRCTWAAVRLSFTWLGTRHSLSTEQKSQAAEHFGAEGEYDSAAETLLDTSHPSFQAVINVRHRLVAYWQSMTLPYPEPGIRLMRHDDLPVFNAHATALKAELADAVVKLDARYSQLREHARQRLGSHYREADYPVSLSGWFDARWDFPTLEPPDYLRQLSPELYEQESERVSARFNEAVKLAEQAFLEELTGLVTHLAERLSGHDDGRPKVFRDTAVTNLQEFFERFGHLNIRSSQALAALVYRTQRIVGGVEPQQLRDSTRLRGQMGKQLSALQETLDGFMADLPRRNILRRPA